MTLSKAICTLNLRRSTRLKAKASRAVTVLRTNHSETFQLQASRDMEKYYAFVTSRAAIVEIIGRKKVLLETAAFRFTETKKPFVRERARHNARNQK